jgi:hypothetical protein
MKSTDEKWKRKKKVRELEAHVQHYEDIVSRPGTKPQTREYLEHLYKVLQDARDELAALDKDVK